MNCQSFKNPSDKDATYYRSLNAFVVTCAQKGCAER